MQTTTYKLNITPGGIPLTIHISQYDVGLREYTFEPYTNVGEFTYVPGANATLEATKPDGYAVIHECVYNQDGSITYTVQEQLAAVPGRVWSKVVIRDGVDILGTGAIIWVVDYAGVRDDAIVSDSDVSGIRGLVEAEVRNALAATLPVDKASGAVASFSAGVDNVPVDDLKISIEPVQSGSGVPSPSNIRPISGWTAANVYRSGADTSNPTVYNISMGTAGTVYGGTLDVTTGVLTVDKAYYDVPSTDWVNLSTAGVYRHAAPTPAPLSTLSTDPTGIYSNETNVTKYSYGTMKDNYPAISIDSSGRIYIAISNDIGSTDAAMAWLAQHPLSIVYPVASPQTYQLTPTEVRTLLGINNIWADTGDTEVAYRADTAQYIEKRISATQSIIAGIEAEYKASRAYSANQFMIVNNQLYKATTSIASGATITPGTNVTATTASEILTQLLNA